MSKTSSYFNWVIPFNSIDQNKESLSTFSEFISDLQLNLLNIYVSELNHYLSQLPFAGLHLLHFSMFIPLLDFLTWLLLELPVATVERL